MDSPCTKQTVCKVLKIFQYGKYLVAYVLKEIKKRQLLIEESDKTACHYGHLWLHLYTVHSVIRDILFFAGPNYIRFFNECPGAL